MRLSGRRPPWRRRVAETHSLVVLDANTGELKRVVERVPAGLIAPLEGARVMFQIGGACADLSTGELSAGFGGLMK